MTRIQKRLSGLLYTEVDVSHMGEYSTTQIIH